MPRDYLLKNTPIAAAYPDDSVDDRILDYALRDTLTIIGSSDQYTMHSTESHTTLER